MTAIQELWVRQIVTSAICGKHQLVKELMDAVGAEPDGEAALLRTRDVLRVLLGEFE